MPTRSTAVLAGSALAILVTMPGCLVTSSSESAYSGNRVEPNADRAVTLHETSSAETIAMLGEPTDRVTEGDEEVLSWRWTARRASSGSVFLIFGGSSETTQDHALSIAFRDGVAVRKWRH
jgi:hypothetical protein